MPTQLIVGDRVYKDRLELTADEFLERLRAGVDASTSQPAPQDFRDAYADALRGAETVVAVVVSRALSGTWANAEAAARAVGDGRVTVVDSRSASLGEGLLVLRGLELARRVDPGGHCAGAGPRPGPVRGVFRGRQLRAPGAVGTGGPGRRVAGHAA